MNITRYATFVPSNSMSFGSAAGPITQGQIGAYLRAPQNATGLKRLLNGHLETDQQRTELAALILAAYQSYKGGAKPYAQNQLARQLAERASVSFDTVQKLMPALLQEIAGIERRS